MLEKRQHKRIGVSLEARWEGLSGKKPRARVSDLSLSGCYFEAISQATFGEVIHFAIQTPTGNWVELQGEVVYVMPGMGFGVRFVLLGDSEIEVLKSLIEYEEGTSTN
ncbi:MAG: hypothetical protein NVSMB56_06420 [Pyrinomonadaceae bacterium]